MCLDLLYHKKKKLSIKTAHKSEKVCVKLKYILQNKKKPFLTTHFSFSSSDTSIYFKSVKFNSPLFVRLFIRRYGYFPPSTEGLLVPYLTSVASSPIVHSFHFLALQNWMRCQKINFQIT